MVVSIIGGAKCLFHITITSSVIWHEQINLLDFGEIQLSIFFQKTKQQPKFEGIYYSLLTMSNINLIVMKKSVIIILTQ